MAKAFGGVQAIDEQAHLNPTQLYRTLSPEGQSCTEQLFCNSQVNGYAPFSAADTASGTHLNR
jgi:hypothetical protein